MNGTTDGLTILIIGGPSLGREWFINRLSMAMEEATCQTTIKPDRFGEVCSRKTRPIKTEYRWTTITLVNQIVEYESIGSIIPTNNTIHSMRLSCGAGFVIIGVMIEIANGEKFEPGLGFWFDAVHDFIWSCGLVAKMARYLIKHHSCVSICIEQKIMPNSLHGDICE